MRRALSFALALALAGCATVPPAYIGQGPHPQITRGQPIAVVDGLGNIFAVLTKLILWNWKVDNHYLSPKTEDYLVRYIEWPQSKEAETHFNLNEYSPGRALKRLAKNKKVAWPYRLLLGLPITLIVDVLIPGRLFAGLLNGDSYNPFTDTVSIYSDLPSVALHEAGHAHDFNKRRYKGTYALLRIVPFVDLFQEYKASEQAFKYFIDTEDHAQEIEAYKVLYPAFGTYVGAYIPVIGGSVAGAVAGHIIGRTQASTKQRHYADDAQFSRANAVPVRPAAPLAQPTPDSASPIPAGQPPPSEPAAASKP